VKGEEKPEMLGECCKRWWAARQMAQMKVKVAHQMGVNTPRQVAQWFEVSDKASRAEMMIGLGNRCPCHDSPHPEIYREMIAEALRTGDMEKAIDKAAELLKEKLS